MAPPDRMLSSSPKSTDPVDKLDPELSFFKLSVESYLVTAEKGSEPAGLVEDMNQVKVKKLMNARTTVNVKCCRRAMSTMCVW